jgi:rhodanese-related sulfurtransferase
MFENLNAVVFEKEMQNSPDAVVLDVRTAWEFESGHIEGAVHLDFFSPTLEAELHKLDKSKYYLIYCRSGARSYTACSIMASSGFAKVANMMGGLMAWRGDLVVNAR